MKEKVQENKITKMKIDLQSIKVDQDFHEKIGVTEKLISLKARKPARQEFVTAQPDSNFSTTLVLLNFSGDKQTYVVTKSIAEYVDDCFMAVVNLAVNTQNEPFLWYVRLDKPGKPVNEWNRTAAIALSEGRKSWVKVVSNSDTHSYRVLFPTVDLGSPKWPEESFEELVNIAFRDRFINDLDHLVIKKLKGEAR